MTLRIVAGLKPSAWESATARLDTGSPVSTYARTMSRQNLLVPPRI